MSRYAEMYKNDVAPALMKKFNYKSPMQIPKFDKIVVNVGAGDAKENSKVIDSIIEEITMITGQKAVPTYAKKSVANFKLREGVKIGVMIREVEDGLGKISLRTEAPYDAAKICGLLGGGGHAAAAGASVPGGIEGAKTAVLQALRDSGVKL